MVSEELVILRICTHTHTQTLANPVKAWLLLSEEGASPDIHLMQGPEKYGQLFFWVVVLLSSN
jgi:hypothetical protein